MLPLLTPRPDYASPVANIEQQRFIRSQTTLLAHAPPHVLAPCLRYRINAGFYPFQSLLAGGLLSETRVRRRRRDVSPSRNLADVIELVADDVNRLRGIDKVRKLKRRKCVRAPIIEVDEFTDSDCDNDDPNDSNYEP